MALLSGGGYAEEVRLRWHTCIMLSPLHASAPAAGLPEPVGAVRLALLTCPGYQACALRTLTMHRRAASPAGAWGSIASIKNDVHDGDAGRGAAAGVRGRGQRAARARQPERPRGGRPDGGHADRIPQHLRGGPRAARPAGAHPRRRQRRRHAGAPPQQNAAGPGMRALHLRMVSLLGPPHSNYASERAPHDGKSCCRRCRCARPRA